MNIEDIDLFTERGGWYHGSMSTYRHRYRHRYGDIDIDKIDLST